MSSLVAENIFVRIGMRDILNGVTIRADRGKITGLLGRNGCGKSTMLKAMFGTMRAYERSVFLDGQYVRKLYTINKGVNYLPQHAFLPPGFKISRILQDFEVGVPDIISDFPELEADIDKRVGELSGGLDRLWSALILVYADTKFTLLDEPFTHIMPLHIERLKQVLLKQKLKKGIIITDHMYRHLLDVSDTIYLMKEGKTIYIKEREDIVLHGYLRELIDW